MIEKKYTLALTQKQLKVLNYACDQFSRLICGQDWSYQNLMEEAWEKRSKKATGKSMDKEFEGGWQEMRHDAERLSKEIKKRFWGLESNALYGIHYDDYADILFDLHRVLRHQLWKDNETKSNWTVDAEDPTHSIGNEPLAKIKVMDYEKEYNNIVDTLKSLIDDGKKQGHIIIRIEDIENSIPEFKESEDELTWLTKYIEEEAYSLSIDIRDDEDRIKLKKLQKALAWLEKQDVKQSLPIPNERAWLYLVADVLTWKDGIGQYLDDPRVQKLAKKLCGEYAQRLYNKQETDDKVEPKFKAGEWITDGEKVWKIGYIEDDMYIEHHGSISDGGTIESIDKRYHLWTIKDAKDGDVLVDEDNNIGLYRRDLSQLIISSEEKDGLDDWESYIYLGCDNRLYGFSMGGYHSIKNTKPATKEQSDLLFQKIKAKGYKWDAEKKALKEIEIHNSDKVDPKFKVGEWV